MSQQQQQSSLSNDSFRSPGSKTSEKGELMTGLAFGVGTQLANISVAAIQKSELRPHVSSNSDMTESKQKKTPILPYEFTKNENDSCLK